MKIKQFGFKSISNKEILKIIDLMKIENEDFKYHSITRITIWNSKLLWLLYNIFTLYIFTSSGKDILKGITKGEYNNFSKEIEIFLFVPKKQYKKQSENKIRFKEFLKLEVIYNLSHEFRHNYQSIFYPEKYQEACISYSKIKWEDQWVEQDTCSFSKQFMDNNHEAINQILNLNYSWSVNIYIDKKY